MKQRKKTEFSRAYFQGKEKEWEDMCIRCGGCCGSFDDPCAHLARDEAGKYYCLIYEERYGDRRTVKGESFRCVHITQVWNTHWKNDYLCAYKQYRKFGTTLVVRTQHNDIHE